MSALWLVVLGGCSSPPPAEPSPARWVEAAEVERYEVIGASGNAPLRYLVRAVNRYGASVRADDVVGREEGAPVTADFDSLGYAELVRTRVGSAAVEFEGVSAQVHAFRSDWPSLGLPPAWEAVLPDGAPVEEVVPVDAGVVLRSGAELWWVGVDRPPHVVLASPDPLLGVRGGDVDVDGVGDVVAWTETEVLVLRGRLAGGLGFGGALEAPGLRVGGVDFGDVSGDNLPDLVVAWAGETSWLDIWLGDGLGGFSPVEPKLLEGTPADLSLGDNTGEDLAQITVLSADGDWSRWIDGGEGRFMPIGPVKPAQIRVPSDATLEGGLDLDGDDATELLLIGPYSPSSDRDLSLVQLVDGIAKVELGEVGVRVALGDGNADGAADVFLQRPDGELRVITYEKSGVRQGAYETTGAGPAPELGELAAGTFLSGDPAGDLFVAGDTFWWFLEGFTSKEDDLVQIPWVVSADGAIELSEGVRPPLVGARLDVDPSTTHLVAISEAAGRTGLVVWQHRAGEPQPQRWGEAPLNTQVAPVLDLAVCLNRAFVLVGGRLIAVDLSRPGSLNVAAEVPSSATRVACAEDGLSTVAAVLDPTGILVVDRDLRELSRAPLGRAIDVALVVGAAGPEVFTCEVNGCLLEPWPRSDGSVWLAEGSPLGAVLIDPAGARTEVAGRGRPLVADVDGDAQQDVLFVAAGAPWSVGTLVSLYRSTSTSFGQEAARSLPLVLVDGWAALGDQDGDGHHDLFGVRAGSALVATRPPRVIGGETFDTGAPLDTAGADTGPTSPETGDTGSVDTRPDTSGSAP